MLKNKMDHLLSNIYIYGAGEYGQICKDYLNNICGINIKGFLVSDDSVYEESEKRSRSIFSYRILEDMTDVSVIVSVSNIYWDDISECISQCALNNTISIIYIDHDEIYEMRRNLKPFDSQRILTTTEAVSEKMGTDRGTSISRYYINKFLDMATARIPIIVEKTNEVGGTMYSKKFYPDASKMMIDYSNNGDDLTRIESLHHEKCDVFICTQVFNFIFDVKAAIEGAYYLLKPNGYMLATVAGNISQVSRYDMDNWGDYWRFTYLSIKKLIATVFGEDNIDIQVYGNLLATTAYIQGLAVEDLPNPSLLDIEDDEYALVIGIIARKGQRNGK